jgi:hypothetical protein
MKTQVIKIFTLFFFLSTFLLTSCEQEEVIPEKPERPPQVENLMINLEPMPDSSHVKLPVDGPLRINYKLSDNSKIVRQEFFLQINMDPQLRGYFMSPDLIIDADDISFSVNTPLYRLWLQFPDELRYFPEPGDVLHFRITAEDDMGQVTHRFFKVTVI